MQDDTSHNPHTLLVFGDEIRTPCVSYHWVFGILVSTKPPNALPTINPCSIHMHRILSAISLSQDFDRLFIKSFFD
jgi:hypothetical protein